MQNYSNQSNSEHHPQPYHANYVPPNSCNQPARNLSNFFLWGSTSQKKKLYLLNWQIITTTKEQGGLGIQRLRPKNNVILASTAWMLFYQPQTPWVSF